MHFEVYCNAPRLRVDCGEAVWQSSMSEVKLGLSILYDTIIKSVSGTKHDPELKFGGIKLLRIKKHIYVLQKIIVYSAN